MDTEKIVTRDTVYVVREVIVPYRGRKIHARAVRTFGRTDVLLIFDDIPAGWDDMEHTEKPNGIDAAVVVECHEHKKEECTYPKPEENGELTHERMNVSCLKIFFVILGVLAVAVAIALIIVAILTCIATRAYDADQSSRIVAMVLLAVTAAFTICMVIYMEVSTFKCQKKPIIWACTTIMILIIVQALIGGISVNVQPSDEARLVKSLTDSFKLAKEDVSRHYKLWAMTQHDLNCCGLYGPQDYQIMKQPYYYPPEVPISCCSDYDPRRSDLVQEKERQNCKTKKAYFNSGCKDLVVMVFTETAYIVLTVNVVLIVVQMLLLIVGVILSRKLKTIDSQQCTK